MQYGKTGFLEQGFSLFIVKVAKLVRLKRNGEL